MATSPGQAAAAAAALAMGGTERGGTPPSRATTRIESLLLHGDVEALYRLAFAPPATRGALAPVSVKWLRQNSFPDFGAKLDILLTATSPPIAALDVTAPAAAAAAVAAVATTPPPAMEVAAAAAAAAATAAARGAGGSCLVRLDRPGDPLRLLQLVRDRRCLNALSRPSFATLLHAGGASRPDIDRQAVMFALEASSADVLRRVCAAGAMLDRPAGVGGAPAALIAAPAAVLARQAADTSGGSSSLPPPTLGETSALHISTARGRPDLTHVLLEYSADVGARDRNRYTPVHTACIGGSVLCVFMVCARGGTVDPSVYAAASGKWLGAAAISSVLLAPPAVGPGSVGIGGVGSGTLSVYGGGSVVSGSLRSLSHGLGRAGGASVAGSAVSGSVSGSLLAGRASASSGQQAGAAASVGGAPQPNGVASAAAAAAVASGGVGAASAFVGSLPSCLAWAFVSDADGAGGGTECGGSDRGGIVVGDSGIGLAVGRWYGDTSMAAGKGGGSEDGPHSSDTRSGINASAMASLARRDASGNALLQGGCGITAERSDSPSPRRTPTQLPATLLGRANAAAYGDGADAAGTAARSEAFTTLPALSRGSAERSVRFSGGLSDSTGAAGVGGMLSFGSGAGSTPLLRVRSARALSGASSASAGMGLGASSQSVGGLATLSTHHGLSLLESATVQETGERESDTDSEGGANRAPSALSHSGAPLIPPQESPAPESRDGTPFGGRGSVAVSQADAASVFTATASASASMSASVSGRVRRKAGATAAAGSRGRAATAHSAISAGGDCSDSASATASATASASIGTGGASAKQARKAAASRAARAKLATLDDDLAATAGGTEDAIAQLPTGRLLAACSPREVDEGPTLDGDEGGNAADGEAEVDEGEVDADGDEGEGEGEEEDDDRGVVEGDEEWSDDSWFSTLRWLDGEEGRVLDSTMPLPTTVRGTLTHLLAATLPSATWAQLVALMGGLEPEEGEEGGEGAGGWCPPLHAVMCAAVIGRREQTWRERRAAVFSWTALRAGGWEVVADSDDGDGGT